jgi:cytidylate kinase
MSHDDFQALIAYVQATHLRQGHPELPPPVISIARDHGAGGEEIAAALGEKLDVKVFDKEILNRVIRAAESDPSLLRMLDENLPRRAGLSLVATFMGEPDLTPDYIRLLTRVVNGIAHSGGILLGRGAHLLLQGPRRFRVRIVGSPDVCARRLAGNDTAAVAGKTAEVNRINTNRAAYIKEYFNVSHDDPLQYDLMINTDHFGNLADVAEVILKAYRVLVD